MAGSTYSTNLKLELMTTGENSGTWGDVTNTNLGTALEQAVVGYGNPAYVSDANLTISITNTNASQAARALVLNVTSTFGSLTATRELVVPTIQKQYIVQNNTTGGQSITVKTSAGTGITVPNGRKAHLYVDGTNVIQMFDFVDINGGAIDGTTIGASSASTGAFTTLNASGATTLDGNVTLGNASGDTVTVTGTIASNLLFTDNTYDIGASGATRPRNLYLAGAATIGGNLSVGGTLTLTGGLTLNGNVTVGDSAADTLTINSTVTSNLIFTDNTYDIGASGATRPRNLFIAGNITAGGSQTLTGSLTVDSTTDSSSTTTGSIQTDGGVGIAKSLYVGGNTTLGDATTDTVTVNGYMGVGGAAQTRAGLWLTSSALSGGAQEGIVSLPVGTSAATATIRAVVGTASTAAASFTATNVSQFWAGDSTKGAGSTITNQHGLYIADQTQGTNNYGITSLVSSGTNKWNFYASGTAANYFAGDVGINQTSPSGRLHVTGSAGSTYITTAGNQIVFTRDSANYISASTGSSSLLIFEAGGSQERLRLGASEAVFNDPGNDYDFRVESDTNTHALFVDAGNSRVGVNNSAPAYALDVSSAAETAIRINSATGYDTVLRLAVNGTNKWAIFNEVATDDFVLYSNATTAERLRLTDGGNLGLGTTPSAWSSSIRALQLYGGRAAFSSDTTSTWLSNNWYNDGADKYVATAAASIYRQASGAHEWYTAPSGTAGNTITFTQRLAVGTTEAVFNEPGADYDFRVESDTNTHMLFVDASQDVVLINTNTSVGVGSGAVGKQQIATTGAAIHLSLANYNASDTDGGILALGKSRGATVGSYTVVQNGDTLGEIRFAGADGTDLQTIGATIRAQVDGTPGGNDMPSRLVFLTTADGSATAAEVARITSDKYLRMASGTGGIQFNGDTAAANALDDYEEGTWTPSATYTTPGTLSITYNEQYGYYTKVGRQVTVVGMVAINTFSKGTASGSLIISGLPFAMASLTRNQAHGSLSQYNAPTSTTAGAFPALGSVAGGSYLSVGYFNNSGLGLVVDPANGSQYFFTMTYFTS